MERRTFLSATGLSIPLLGGCLADNPGRSTQTDSPEASSEDSPSTDEAENSSEEVPSSSMDAQGPARGESNVEIEIQESEDDENVEYIEKNSSVRYVAGWRHTNQEEIEEGESPEREPFFETTPFEQWGKTQCVSAAAHAAAEHVNDELDTDEVGGGITSGVEGEDTAAVVSVTTILDREGKVVQKTDVEFEALVAATPATVEATYVLGEHEYELNVPVYARYDVLQQQ